jgi:hypothetical protein
VPALATNNLFSDLQFINDTVSRIVSFSFKQHG